jgi:hypothetical protein
MALIVRKFVFAIALLRLAAALVVAGALGYGAYILVHGEVLAGLTWIFISLSSGYVGNKLFRLVYMLGSAGAATSASAMQTARIKYGTGSRTRFAGSGR